MAVSGGSRGKWHGAGAVALAKPHVWRVGAARGVRG
jgi:hypothetical protein